MVQKDIERKKRTRNAMYAGLAVLLTAADVVAGIATYKAFTSEPSLQQVAVPTDIGLLILDGLTFLAYKHYVPRISRRDRVTRFGSEPRSMRQNLSRGYDPRDRSNRN